MTLRSLTGYGYLLVGVAGCVLPIMPGIPFLIAGAAILVGATHWSARRQNTCESI
jgi:uncharacterized membrane protein YbaN (DUF454 family)